MTLDGSIIVEICDETMAKVWRKPVEMWGLFACMLFFFEVFSTTSTFGVCFSFRLLSYGDGDPSKPHLNLVLVIAVLGYLSLSLRKLRPKN